MLLLATKVWEQRKPSDYLKESKIPGGNGEGTKKLTVKLWGKGVTKKKTIYQGSSNTQYYIRKSGQLIYGKLDFLHAAFGLVPKELDGYESTIDSPSFDVLHGDSEFLLNYFLRKDFYLKNGQRANGSRKAKRINQKTFLNMIIYCPSQMEQSKISGILSKINRLITLYAKKSSCLDSCIAYFIRILYDDPQFFKQKNVQNSIIKSFKLDDILIKNNAKNKDLSILNVESISNKKGFISQKEQFDNYQVASKDLSNYYVIHPKDFAYNPSRINVGSIAYKSPNDVKGIVSPLYVSFKCKNDIVLDKYLWHWFKSTNFEHQRVRLSEGGVRDTLSFNQLSKMKISIPSFEIQRQTINLLEILIQYKEEVDLKLNNLKLIKNTLLQTMFL